MAEEHDKLFRFAFGSPEQIRSLLQNLLPPAVRDAADWSTLKLEDGALIDKKFKKRFTDLLFRVRIGDSEAFILVLVEHQSRPHPWMPMRLLGYQLRIWERHLQHDPGAKGLPLICPIVVYHGPRPWNAPRCLADVLDADDSVIREAARAELIPDFRFALLDLTAHDDENLHELIVSEIGCLVASALKHGPYDRRPLEILPIWVEAWRRAIRAPGGTLAVATVMRYLLEIRDDVTAEQYQSVLQSHLSPEETQTVMSAAEKLREEGRQEGRQEGRIELMLELLTRRFGPLPVHAQQRVREASLENLERMLQAETVDDILR